MNALKKSLDSRGLTPIEASKIGVPYHNIYKQYKGERNVGIKSALLYERVLGIPRSELRPDLWPPKHITPISPTNSRESESGGYNAR